MRQDIEASVIGGLLIGGLTPTASDVLATLEPEAFSIPLYRKAFEVIRKQARNRNLIDALMVAEACGEEHFTSILMTSKNCPSAANLKGYAGMVADNYHRRLVLEIMDEMREPIQSGTIDTSSQAMDELVKRLSAIRKPRDEVKPVRLSASSSACHGLLIITVITPSPTKSSAIKPHPQSLTCRSVNVM